MIQQLHNRGDRQLTDFLLEDRVCVCVCHEGCESVWELAMLWHSITLTWQLSHCGSWGGKAGKLCDSHRGITDHWHILALWYLTDKIVRLQWCWSIFCSRWLSQSSVHKSLFHFAIWGAPSCSSDRFMVTSLWFTFLEGGLCKMDGVVLDGEEQYPLCGHFVFCTC